MRFSRRGVALAASVTATLLECPPPVAYAAAACTPRTVQMLPGGDIWFAGGLLQVGYDHNTALFADCYVPGYLEVFAQTPLAPASLLARPRTDVKAAFVEDRDIGDAAYGARRLHRDAAITIHFVRRR